jgi:P-type Ca2+ transporter type 2C
LRFIMVTGVVKALTGGALLVLLPLYGFSLAVTRTAVFLYESIAQLVFAYPSRRVSVLPLPNGWLHLAVLFGAGLQILTIALPSLRLLLGLEPLGLQILLWMAGGVLVSWLVAEVFSRFAWARGHRRGVAASSGHH